MNFYLKFLLSSLVLFLCIAIALSIVGIKVNMSASIPKGIYIKSRKTMEKGDFVIFCPPNNGIFEMALERHYLPRGYCSIGSAFLFKQIAGEEGDEITSNRQGVIVNKVRLPLSKPFTQDALGMKLPHFIAENYKLKKTELLLMSVQNPLSFDARYFGLINKSKIISVVKPIFVW